MRNIRVAITAVFMLGSFCGANDLNGARGKIFNVDFSTKSFELLKATAYDPITPGGSILDLRCIGMMKPDLQR